MARQILRAEAAAIASVPPDTFSAYVARSQAPAPVDHVGRTPLWDEDAIREWVRTRPGRGSRGTDRARQRAAERESEGSA